MIFDDHGKIERIEPYERNDAHRLIEECMLAANVCASEFLREREHPVLYRMHEGPTPERLTSCATSSAPSVSAGRRRRAQGAGLRQGCWRRSGSGRIGNCCRP
jgi:exoribonuclease II